MQIIKKTAFSLLILLTFHAHGQHDTLGLLSSEMNINASETTKDWGKLVGNWNIVFEAVDESGKVQQSFEAEWNWFYILDGYAIQDVFILPPRNLAKKTDSPFYGVGVRIFDEDTNKWQSVWVDTSNKKLEFREATSTAEQITMYQTNAKGEKLRITYFDMAPSSFEWKQEVLVDNKNWVITQLIHAKKAS